MDKYEDWKDEESQDDEESQEDEAPINRSRRSTRVILDSDEESNVEDLRPVRVPIDKRRRDEPIHSRLVSRRQENSDCKYRPNHKPLQKPWEREIFSDDCNELYFLRYKNGRNLVCANAEEPEEEIGCPRFIISQVIVHGK